MNLKKTICHALIVSTVALSFQASAGMIGAEKAAPAQAQTDRAAVLATLARADTASKLEALGVDPQKAGDRVGAMSDQEVTQLAQDIRNAPAGAGSGWVVVLVIVAAVWYFVFRR